jgi:zinc and cadmium transporter
VSPPASLLVFSAGVVAAALAGGSVPLWSRGSPRTLELFLAASAGVMLGVVGGHMLPEAFDGGGANAAWALVAGFVFMLLVERFVLPHALHAPHAAEEHAACDPAIERDHARADAAGVGVFLGLALHTVVDGVVLGTALAGDGLVAGYIFLAIVVHKIPSAFALGSILVRAGVPARRVLLAVAALGAMVGLGGALFLVARSIGEFDAGRLTPFALAFSAGSFLHAAVTDLLPDLHRRGSARRGLLVALFGGLALMVGLSYLLPG